MDGGSDAGCSEREDRFLQVGGLHRTLAFILTYLGRGAISIESSHAPGKGVRLETFVTMPYYVTCDRSRISPEETFGRRVREAVV